MKIYALVKNFSAMMNFLNFKSESFVADMMI